MLIKFAIKRVNGWKCRHLNQMKVVSALRIRMRNGFTLKSDERKFYDDTKSLFELYNPNKSFYS